MAKDYDVIVVGARCAGSPTAMLLARRGYRVLLVDRATFPSDTLSTHLVHPPGAAALRRWGLLERVLASGCTPIWTYSFDAGPLVLTGSPRPDGDVATALAPRRTVLDAILVDAAVQAGAELRDRFNVESVVGRTAWSVGSEAGRPAARPLSSGPGSWSAPTAAIPGWPRPWGPSGTGRSPGCRAAGTATGAACPSRAVEF